MEVILIDSAYWFMIGVVVYFAIPHLFNRFLPRDPACPKSLFITGTGYVIRPLMVLGMLALLLLILGDAACDRLKAYLKHAAVPTILAA